MEACHGDGDSANNRLGNLRWDTPTNNHADKILHGTTNRGERSGTAKLTDAAVGLAFALREAGWLVGARPT
jgi:hypothetical protein